MTLRSSESLPKQKTGRHIKSINHLLILPFLAVLAIASPTIELVHDADRTAVIAAWHRAEVAAPKPILAIGNEPLPGIKAGDVMLWDRGRIPAVGNWFIGDFPTRNLFGAIREAKAVTATTVTTVSGTTIPLSQVQGTVRRVVRFMP